MNVLNPENIILAKTEITMMKLKSWILGVGLLISNVAFSQTVQDGFRFLDRHQPSRAKQVFEGLVASAPTGDNYFNLGLYYLHLRNWDNAKATFEKGKLRILKTI